jgi:LDH2 family malate/lactate/ureidoglycolate dehydrogenase
MKPTVQTVEVIKLEQFCITALRKSGLNETDARITTDVLITTDTFGVFTHGVKSLRGYIRRLRAGGLKADAVPRIVKEGPAWAIVDGQSAIGMVTSVFAMNTAIAKAKKTGMAYVGVRNSCHFGAAGYYALIAAKADMIGLAMANDTPSMAVPGSKKAVLGTNPFAYAVPSGEENPVFMDIASSAVAGGKIRIMQAKREKVPLGWLVDEEGVPTTDPFAYPFKGALLPFASHKGYGFAVMIECFSALATGAAAMEKVRSWIDDDPSLPTLHGAAFFALDIGAMTDLNDFKKRMDKMIRDIRQAPRAKGSDRIYLPGEMEWERRRKSLVKGIPLPDDVLSSLQALADELEISFKEIN